MIDLTNRYDFLGAAVLFESSLIGVAMALGWGFDVDLLEKFAWTWGGAAWGTGAAIPMFAVFWLAYRFPVGGLRQIKEFLIEFLGPSLAVCRWYDLLLIAGVAGLGEELLFRGVLHPEWGLIGSNVAFGLLHAITPLYVLFAGLLGFFLGWLLNASDNLLAPIIAHGLYDFLGFLIVASEYRRRCHANSISSPA